MQMEITYDCQLQLSWDSYISVGRQANQSMLSVSMQKLLGMVDHGVYGTVHARQNSVLNLIEMQNEKTSLRLASSRLSPWLAKCSVECHVKLRFLELCNSQILVMTIPLIGCDFLFQLLHEDLKECFLWEVRYNLVIFGQSDISLLLSSGWSLLLVA